MALSPAVFFAFLFSRVFAGVAKYDSDGSITNS